MAKTLPTITRPGRALRRSSSPDPNPPQTLQAAAMMRAMVIGFWALVMSLVWVGPNYMGWGAAVGVTATFTLIASLGLLVLHRVGRKSLRQQRLASGCCVECGYDLRSSPDRCPECGAVARAG